MNVPTEIFNSIMQYTNDPHFIAPFKEYLFKETICHLLAFTSVQDAIIKCDARLLNFLKKRNEIAYMDDFQKFSQNMITLQFIMSGDVKLLDFWKRSNVIAYNKDITEIGTSTWEILIHRTSRMPIEMILEFKDHVDIKYISQDYELSDDSIIVLADVLDWHIMNSTRHLSFHIQLKFLYKKITPYELAKHQKFIHDDIVRSCLDGDYYSLIIYNGHLTSAIFREYYHEICFIKMHEDYECLDMIIESEKYDKDFFSDTADLVDWKAVSTNYYQRDYQEKKEKMKRFF